MRFIVPDNTGHIELVTANHVGFKNDHAKEVSIEDMISQAEAFMNEGRRLLVEQQGKASLYPATAQELKDYPDATVWGFRPLMGG